ncbi:hypothetical protein JCM19275_433 [Nonlabens ulvanivorans]|uniref:Uncharacterized protein n=1 Tax=Nonlabens ulvanivorans TaxID=906888 RepID=A0A090Q7Q6_NONUL|nr:hypothetical protein JCM19314_3145 [Nonlabens ulvanivorans]GAL75272.1 hypothetical protein JCM19275_433 [Nonlabens ulvanivorans]
MNFYRHQVKIRNEKIRSGVLTRFRESIFIKISSSLINITNEF